MFAVHISNLIELPIHDKLKNNRKGADFSEIFLRRCMHMGKLSVLQLMPKMTVDQLQKMMENATV